MPAIVPVPTSMAALLANPQRVRDAFALLNALSQMRCLLVVQSAATDPVATKPVLIGDPPNIVLQIPLKLASPIANSTADATSVSAQLNALLAALRVTGQLPT